MSDLPEKITVRNFISWLCENEPEELLKQEYFTRGDVAFVTFGARYMPELEFNTREAKKYHETRVFYLYEEITIRKINGRQQRKSPPNPPIWEPGTVLPFDSEIQSYLITRDKEGKSKLSPELDKEIDIILEIGTARDGEEIPPEILALIMAYEECDDSDLQKLFRAYIPQIDKNEFDISTPEKRIYLWHELLYRLMGWDYKPYGRPIGSRKKFNVTDDARILLREFWDFRKKVKSDYNVNIPLPESLFPKESELALVNNKTDDGKPTLILAVDDNGWYLCVSNKKEDKRYGGKSESSKRYKIAEIIVQQYNQTGSKWIPHKTFINATGWKDEDYYGLDSGSGAMQKQLTNLRNLGLKIEFNKTMGIRLLEIVVNNN